MRNNNIRVSTTVSTFNASAIVRPNCLLRANIVIPSKQTNVGYSRHLKRKKQVLFRTLQKKPEVFPKQVDRDQIGSFDRVPGKSLSKGATRSISIQAAHSRPSPHCRTAPDGRRIVKLITILRKSNYYLFLRFSVSRRVEQRNLLVRFQVWRRCWRTKGAVLRSSLDQGWINH